MKIKRLKKLRVNSNIFNVTWKKQYYGASFNYFQKQLVIGIGDNKNEEMIFELLTHELMELAAVILAVRLDRPDVDSDYIFVLDHRQFDTLVQVYSGLVLQFLG